MNQAPLSPTSALLAHVEPLLLNRRILVVGNAGNSVASHLLERGARLVQVLDPDPKRVALAAAQNTERRVTFAQLTPHSLRDGSFEVALVEDVELADNFTQLIAGIKRSLGNNGLAIFCARNMESSSALLGVSCGGISYDQLSDALWDQFETVSLWGQSPFLGYSIVQFGLDHAPIPVLDNGYLGSDGEAPDFYIAICENGAGAPLAEMSIIQLPSARLLSDSESGHRDKEQRAKRRAEALELELGQLRKQVSSSEVERLVTLLEERDRWIGQLQAKTKHADTRADDFQGDIDELEQELEATHKALLKEKSETVQLRGELERVKTERSVAKSTELEKATAELRAAQRKNAELEKKLHEAHQHEQEVAHLSAGRKALEEEINALAEENTGLKKATSHQVHMVDKLQKRVSALDSEVDELHKQLDEVEQLQKRLDETEDFLRDAEDELRETRLKLSSAIQSATNEGELNSLEEQLRERGRRVIELESQLRKIENYCHTLKAELSNSNGAAEPENQIEFEQLSRTLAEREADLVEAQWTIGQLTRSMKN